MSFESAVTIAQITGVVGSILWLSVPVTVVISIVRRRRYRPGSSNWLAYSVLGVWILTVVLCVMTFVSGGWYGENGPPPLTAAIEATTVLLVLVAVHFAILRTSANAERHGGDST
jgi:hypothetical protein